MGRRAATATPHDGSALTPSHAARRRAYVRGEMAEYDQIAQLEEEIRRNGWVIRWTVNERGYRAEARRADAPHEGQAQWGAGGTRVDALEELLSVLYPFQYA